MFFIYIVANKRNGTLYTGHTDDLGQRILEHKDKAGAGFSAKYGCDRLVWFKTHETRDGAFRRERQIKEWQRAWKIRRIVRLNPNWDDLYRSLPKTWFMMNGGSTNLIPKLSPKPLIPT